MISVIIPTHNRSQDLILALKSVYSQTHLPYEIIVVDDGSSPAILEEIFDSAPESIKCMLLRNNKAKGANFSRNLGVQAATGQYIAFLDDDDQFYDNKLECVNKLIRDVADVDLIYHPAEVHMVNQNVTYVSKPKIFSNSDNLVDELLLSNYIGGTSMVVLRKTALIDIGYFDVSMPALQDYELWLRFAMNKCKFIMLDMPLTRYYVVTKKKAISTNVDASYEAVRLITEKYASYYAKLPSSKLKQREIRLLSTYIYKRLLCGEKAKALGLQLYLISKRPTFKNIAFFIVASISVNLLFKLRALL